MAMDKITNDKTKMKHSQKPRKKWLLILLAIFFVAILSVIGLIVRFEYTYAQKFYPGVAIGRLNVAGQTKDYVLKDLKLIEKDIQAQGLLFNVQDKEIAADLITISAADPDLAKSILSFDWEKTVDYAYSIGRGGSWWENLYQQFRISVLGERIGAVYDLDERELLNILQASFSELEKPPLNARLNIQDDEVEVLGEQSGYVLDYQTAIGQLKKNINDLSLEKITLNLIFTEPEIKKEHTGSAVNSLENILAIESLKLTADPYWWTIDKPDFIGWLEFQMADGEVVIGFNQENVLEFLAPIAEKVNIEAQDAKFKLANERVTEFQASRDGKELDLEASYQKINSQIIAGNPENIELAVAVTPAKVATGDLNDLGIKELIGRGVSNFAGSPNNRRHNIAVGANTLDGVLIEPNETFSLIKTLGPINGETGYKTELVIKGDRTIPEYGGGLCQIGTTTFRAALRSGLPIIERQPHSYRVVYYEPAGMDATIYSPSPDVKFLNDTGYHILFTAAVQGDELIFEFYGTKDGREVVIEPDPPSIYNITSPGGVRYVETEELAPGEKRKIESAHAGATTNFKYTVTYPNGEVKETDFTSRYVAWPEIWLVGKDPNAATTTPETTAEEN